MWGHDEPDPSNTLTPRTSAAIALCPENNLQSSYLFLNLTTWKVVARRSWTEVPMSQLIIDQVNEKGREELGLGPNDPIPPDYEFRYMDGTLVVPDDENQGGSDSGTGTEEG